VTLTKGKDRNLEFLCLYFSNFDYLQYKKIRTAAFRNLLIPHDCSEHDKDNSQRTTNQK
jgi:hypothetical protein